MPIEELSADDLVEIVENERASILGAAHASQSLAMLTGTHGVVAPPLLAPRARLLTPEEIHPGAGSSGDPELARLLANVAARAGGEPIAEARARLELARAALDQGDTPTVQRETSAVLAITPGSSAAHATSRVVRLGRTSIDEQLADVTELAAGATSDRVRAAWLAEKARLLEARGDDEAAVDVWREALALDPAHAGVLYGAENAFERHGHVQELGEVLERLARSTHDRNVTAWHEVERALLLDRKLADPAGARARLDAALELAPGIGTVRRSCVDHAVRHRDEPRLAELLEQEAALETDPARAARLELDAALAHRRSGAEPSAVIAILERAHRRAPTSVIVDVRVAQELATLHEEAGRHAEALRVRQASVAWLEDPREELVELRAMIATARAAGSIEDAIRALERARVIDPGDPSLLEELDVLLCDAERHEDRAVLWTREAAHLEDATEKARALLTAADAARAAGREVEAAKTREAAWLTAPNAAGVYDARAAQLVAVAPTEAVRDRAALYEQAADATRDPDRKIHLFEKLAWLRDDVEGDARAAVHVYERILRIEPARLSALFGLASAARRSGDHAALARALIEHASVTGDPITRAELRLEAARAYARCDPERALAIAEEAMLDPTTKTDAAALVTSLHLAAGRWERAASILEGRMADAEGPQKIALAIAEASLHLHRAHAPERALAVLARLPSDLRGDAAVHAATIEALERLGDDERLGAELVRLADLSASFARAKLLLRRAELDERRGRDEAAAEIYAKLPDEPLAVDRLARLGARIPIDDADPLVRAVRRLDLVDAGSAEPLLALGMRDAATLRMAERLARRAGSAPQLANTLALMSISGVHPRRAHEGLATLFTWTLPPNDDDEPWEKLLELGALDAPGLDVLVDRIVRRKTVNLHIATRALEARIELAADATEKLLLHVDRARLLRRSGELVSATKACLAALEIDETSLSAATMLAEIAAERNDRASALRASRSLAKLAARPSVRAELLRDAADLAEADNAVVLLEEALAADPESVQAAARLAELQRERGAFRDLARVLASALENARTAEAIVPMASELAEVAKINLSDPIAAITALERIRDVAPRHVPTLFLLAEMFIGQRAWDKAIFALGEAATSTAENDEKLVALVGRASIFRKILHDDASAERELRAALAIDRHDVRAVKGLLELGIGGDERIELLGRLAVDETTPADRLRVLVELADARRARGDAEGAEGALVEAASLSPDPAMLERLHEAVGNDPARLGRVLARAVSRAREGGRAVDPSWLVRLGTIELDLGRFDEAIERFESVLQVDPSRGDARVALARAYAARGRHEPAAAALLPVFALAKNPIVVDTKLLQLLETSLSGAGRRTEQWVARELRAVAGDLAPREQAELDARLANLGTAEGLSASSLRRSVMPDGIGQHVIWDVATLARELAGKLARIPLTEVGASTRHRVKPRTPHPVRPLFDRVLRAFELVEVELAVSDHPPVPVLAVEDVPWVVVPSSLESFTDPYAIAALARPMARVALGVPWLGAWEGREVLAMLVALARQVVPSFAAHPSIEALVSDHELRARRAIDRRRRKALEEIAHVLEGAPPIDPAAFTAAVEATESRAAFLLSGSLRATLDAVAPSDRALSEALRVPGPPSLSAIFGRASSRALASYALSSETTSLRRSLGTA
jgi:tetratricopeptide (TPR) repeat protein